MPGNTGTGFMYNTSVWTPTLGNHRDGLYASVWIPTLGSGVAHGAWLSFVSHFQQCTVNADVHWLLLSWFWIFKIGFTILKCMEACMHVFNGSSVHCLHFLVLSSKQCCCSEKLQIWNNIPWLGPGRKTCTVHCIKTSFCLLFSCYYGLWQQIICSALQPNLILCWPGLRPH